MYLEHRARIEGWLARRITTRRFWHTPRGEDGKNVWFDKASSGGAGQGMGSLREGLPSKPKKRPSLSFAISTCASPTLVTHGLSFDPRPKVMYPPKPEKAPIPTLPIPVPVLLVVGAEAISIVDMVSRENRT